MRDSKGKVKGTPQAAQAAPQVELKVTRTPQSWGLTAEVALQKLQARPVRVRLADGSCISGLLVGYTQYTLTLKTADGLRVLNKGHMVWLEPAKAVAVGPASKPVVQQAQNGSVVTT